MRAEPKIIKAVVASCPARADEWALRQGLDIAKRHAAATASHEAVFALACDIAEALQAAFNPLQ